MPRSHLVVCLALLSLASCGDDDGGPAGSPDGATPPPPPGSDGGTPPPPPPPGAWVDPGCTDGMYSEAPPDPTASIDDLVAAYDPARVVDLIDGALARRYPVGAAIFRGGASQTRLGDCVELFLDERATAADVLPQIDTLVHECGHFYDLGEGGFSDAAYVITPEVRFSCSSGDTTDRGGSTFARSRLNGDAQADRRQPCGGSFGTACDFYADTYLDGDPDDGSFQSGDQGFDSLLEETVQYVNSLATSYAFHDAIDGRVSARDGILTFLWYVERYLALARTDYPDAYALLSTDACWREAILTVWGRAWMMLGLTEDLSQLGLADVALEELVTQTVMLEEIDRLRVAAGCGG